MKNRELKPSPNTGKVAAKPSEGASWSKYVRNFNLFTHPCPYRLAKLGTSLRVPGKLTLRKKELIVFIYIYSFDDIPCRILRYESHDVFSSINIPILSTAQE